MHIYTWLLVFLSSTFLFMCLIYMSNSSIISYMRAILLPPFDPSGARIHAENSIRNANQALNYRRMAARIDAVAARVQTAITTKQVLYSSGPPFASLWLYSYRGAALFGFVTSYSTTAFGSGSPEQPTAISQQRPSFLLQ